MTASVLSRGHTGFSGLRPVDYRRDLGAVADLITTVFPARVDATGRRMLRQMRLLGRAGWLGWALGWLLLPPAAYSRGYVWEEEGNLVGNASLMRVEGYPGRWVLANVAVAPEFRRRGIGRSLVESCIAMIRQEGARQLVLQVEEENSGAQDLYRGLGFAALTTRTTWVWGKADESGPVIGDLSARLRRSDEWRGQWALAQCLHPEGVLWPYPLESRLFAPHGAPEGAGGPKHWVWPDSGPPAGWLSARRSADGREWRLILLVERGAHGPAEMALLSAALRRLRRSAAEVVLDYDAGLVERELGAMGFQAERRLTWMSLDWYRGGQP